MFRFPSRTAFLLLKGAYKGVGAPQNPKPISNKNSTYNLSPDVRHVPFHIRQESNVPRLFFSSFLSLAVKALSKVDLGCDNIIYAL